MSAMTPAERAAVLLVFPGRDPDDTLARALDRARAEYLRNCREIAAAIPETTP